MKIIIAGLTTLGVFAATPSFADPITPEAATVALQAAATATNNADSYSFQSSLVGYTGLFNRSAGQYEQTGTPVLKSFAATGTYAPISWPTAAARTKVLGPDYLNKPDLQWQLVTRHRGDLEIPLWSDLLEPYSDRMGVAPRVPTISEITAATKTMLPGATQYEVRALGGSSVVYTVDTLGRFTRVQQGSYADVWSYVPVTVTMPAATTVDSYENVQTAIEAATLNRNLRLLARGVAAGGHHSLRSMRSDAREVIMFWNAGGEDEQIPTFVPLKLRSISGGVRMFRRNPITGTFHEWRVTGSGSRWRAYKVAP